ncbi:MAG: hypothetical protein H6679_00485 [Epsilonproteobacteria bacterium]|nr:hypothetical protein [Campylobacterota bacterium]
MNFSHIFFAVALLSTLAVQPLLSMQMDTEQENSRVNEFVDQVYQGTFYKIPMFSTLASSSEPLAKMLQEPDNQEKRLLSSTRDRQLMLYAEGNFVVLYHMVERQRHEPATLTKPYSITYAPTLEEDIVKTFKMPYPVAQGATLSRDGSQLVVLEENNIISVWDTNTWKVLKKIDCYSQEKNRKILKIMINPVNDELLVFSTNYTLTFYGEIDLSTVFCDRILLDQVPAYVEPSIVEQRNLDRCIIS